MNLAAYDSVTTKIDKQKTWLDVDKKFLYSREIKYRKYNTLAKRYNPELEQSDFFIILLDELPTDRPASITKVDNYGRIKINIASIWDEANFNYYDSNCNINIITIEDTNDGNVYQLDI